MTEKIISINDKDYTLKMTRAAVRYGEQIGLNLAAMETQPVTQSTYLLMVALYGGGVRKPEAKMMELADTYLDTCDDMGEVLESLAEMYAEVFHIRELG